MESSRLAIENAVLRQAGALNPVKTRQVVRALESPEYADLLEYDDRNELNPASVNRALKRLAEAEPNLFNTPEAAADMDDGRGNDKAPAKQENVTEEQRLVNDALERMGIKKQNEAGGK